MLKNFKFFRAVCTSLFKMLPMPLLMSLLVPSLMICRVARAEFVMEIDKGRNKIYLLDSACKNIATHIDSLSAWFKIIKENSARSNLDRNCIYLSNRKLFKIEITDFLPLNMREAILAERQRLGSANCWNAALYFNKVSASLRYVDGNEFDQVLRSPLCRELPKSEHPRPGDIGAMSYKRSDYSIDHQHAFIYLNDNLIFQKSGPWGAWELRDLISGGIAGFNSKFAGHLNMKKKLLRDEHPTMSQEQIDHEIISSARQANTLSEGGFNFFRCQSLESYLEGSAVTEMTKRIAELLTNEERVLGRMLQHQDFNGLSKVNSLFDNAKGIINILSQRYQATPEERSNDIKMLGMLLKKIGSMQQETTNIIKNNADKAKAQAEAKEKAAMEAQLADHRQEVPALSSSSALQSGISSSSASNSPNQLTNVNLSQTFISNFLNSKEMYIKVKSKRGNSYQGKLKQISSDHIEYYNQNNQVVIIRQELLDLPTLNIQILENLSNSNRVFTITSKRGNKYNGKFDKIRVEGGKTCIEYTDESSGTSKSMLIDIDRVDQSSFRWTDR